VSPGPQILVVTGERETERAVAAACEEAAQPLAAVCPTLGLLPERLQAQGTALVALVLVDADPQPLAALAAIEPLVSRFPQARFVILCRELSSAIVLEAMQVGARHCLAKASIAAELPGVIRRLGRDLAPADPRGKWGERGERGCVVSVLSASGGCGATTLAINLAEELRLETGRRVLLVDLDRHYGAISTFLGIHGRYGVADVLSHAGMVDPQLVDSTAAVYSEGLQVLLSPASVDFGAPAPMPLERADALLAGCRAASAYTVVDAPRVPPDAAALIANSSDLALIVLELTVVDVRGARALLTALTDRGVPLARVLVLANRCRRRNPMLALEDARDALQGVELVAIGNDFEGALRSMNYGRPLAEVAPRSVIRRDLRALLPRIAPVSASHAAASARNGR
jgi:pilus assembly protein CpaE